MSKYSKNMRNNNKVLENPIFNAKKFRNAEEQMERYLKFALKAVENKLLNMRLDAVEKKVQTIELQAAQKAEKEQQLLMQTQQLAKNVVQVQSNPQPAKLTKKEKQDDLWVEYLESVKEINDRTNKKLEALKLESVQGMIAMSNCLNEFKEAPQQKIQVFKRQKIESAKQSKKDKQNLTFRKLEEEFKQNWVECDKKVDKLRLQVPKQAKKDNLIVDQLEKAFKENSAELDKKIGKLRQMQSPNTKNSDLNLEEKIDKLRQMQRPNTEDSHISPEEPQKQQIAESIIQAELSPQVSKQTKKDKQGSLYEQLKEDMEQIQTEADKEIQELVKIQNLTVDTFEDYFNSTKEAPQKVEEIKTKPKKNRNHKYKCYKPQVVEQPECDISQFDLTTMKGLNEAQKHVWQHYKKVREIWKQKAVPINLEESAKLRQEEKDKSQHIQQLREELRAKKNAALSQNE